MVVLVFGDALRDPRHCWGHWVVFNATAGVTAGGELEAFPTFQETAAGAGDAVAGFLSGARASNRRSVVGAGDEDKLVALRLGVGAIHITASCAKFG